MTLKKIILSAVLACVCVAGLAQTASEFMSLGNRAYEKADFAQAKRFYVDAMAAGGNSAELYFNAANACAKLGDKGEAVLFYKRAQMRNPRLREAEANLRLFAKDNGIQIPEKSAAETYLLDLSLFEWTVAGFAAFWVAVILAFLTVMFGKNNAACVFAAIVLFAVSGVSGYGIWKWGKTINTAVSLKDDVALRLSPTPNAPVCATAQEGQSGEILGEKDGYIYVSTPSGKRGWADRKQFAPLSDF